MFEIRTDLAVEEKEGFQGNGGEISGVSLREWRKAGFLTPQSPESLIWPIFLCQIYFYVLRTIVLYAIIYLYITFRRMP